MDETSAKRAIEILNACISIQDLASSEEVKGVDVLHLTKEEEDKTLERMIIRIKYNKVASVTGGEYTWDLITTRLKVKRGKKLPGTPEQQLANLERKMEGIEEEEGSDNETMAQKTVRKEKRVLRKDGTIVCQLKEELGLGFVEPAVPRPFEEVKTNVFEKTPPGWNLGDSQKGWSQEEKKGKMEWKAEEGQAEIADGQMEEASPSGTVHDKTSQQKGWRRDEDNGSTTELGPAEWKET